MYMNFTDEELSRAYSEVLAFIDALGAQYKNKVPKDMLDTLDMARDKDYCPVYDSSLPMHKQEFPISEAAVALIAAFNLEYWEEDEAKKAKLTEIYKENDRKTEREMYRKMIADDQEDF